MGDVNGYVDVNGYFDEAGGTEGETVADYVLDEGSLGRLGEAVGVHQPRIGTGELGVDELVRGIPARVISVRQRSGMPRSPIVQSMSAPSRIAIGCGVLIRNRSSGA